MAFFAVLTILGAVYPPIELVPAALGVALAVAGYNEVVGGLMLQRFDERGARRLGYNQLGVGAAIVAYAAWSLFHASQSPGLLGAASSGDPETDAMLSGLVKGVTTGLYSVMMVVGVVVPGLTAWYYFSRAKIVRNVIAHSPSWAIDALRVAER